MTYGLLKLVGSSQLRRHNKSFPSNWFDHVSRRTWRHRHFNTFLLGHDDTHAKRYICKVAVDNLVISCGEVLANQSRAGAFRVWQRVRFEVFDVDSIGGNDL